MGNKPMLANNAVAANAKSVEIKLDKKKFKANFAKVTIEEINASRPSVYKYLLP
ncbi:hypothetical protein [Mucilaginibacter psychrotolerans]|uniref:hypothetical protein n=1 Tax=Mucilaginibacter psychrotolerans TaxID=1524096 RepID=UPI0013050F17|nr:hypothetical protein [Mucilaginibacter psychrotolerans]